MARSTKRLALLLGVVTTLAITAAPAAAASAEPPTNDHISSPKVIETFPYTDTMDTTAATSGRTDPAYCGLPEVGVDRATVWYVYRPAESGSIGARTFGSDYDTTLYVGVDDGSGGFRQIDCGDDAGDGSQSAVRFDATAGETYLFMVGTCCGQQYEGPGGGNLVFELTDAPPALEITSVVNTSTFSRDGSATITGTASCTAPADVFTIVSVDLMQPAGLDIVEGYGSMAIEGCPDPDIPWTVTVTPEVGKFIGGPVRARLITTMCNSWECALVEEFPRLRLRGAGNR